MKSYFFNAEPTTDLVNHPTGYDREYDAGDYADYFSPFFNEAGVLAGQDPDACLIYQVSDGVLGIRPGAAYVKGRLVIFEGTERLNISGPCRVVARMNKSADVRAFQLLAVAAVVQTEDIYDLELAAVRATGGGEVELMGGYTVNDTRTYLSFAVRPPNSSVTDAPEKTDKLADADMVAVTDSADGNKLKRKRWKDMRDWLATRMSVKDARPGDEDALLMRDGVDGKTKTVLMGLVKSTIADYVTHPLIGSLPVSLGSSAQLTMGQKNRFSFELNRGGATLPAGYEPTFLLLMVADRSGTFYKTEDVAYPTMLLLSNKLFPGKALVASGNAYTIKPSGESARTGNDTVFGFVDVTDIVFEFIKYTLGSSNKTDYLYENGFRFIRNATSTATSMVNPHPVINNFGYNSTSFWFDVDLTGVTAYTDIVMGLSSTAYIF